MFIFIFVIIIISTNIKIKMIDERAKLFAAQQVKVVLENYKKVFFASMVFGIITILALFINQYVAMVFLITNLAVLGLNYRKINEFLSYLKAKYGV